MNVVYNENSMNERLQKILAHAGVASRRKAEEMIQQGRVSVNGHIVTELGSKADPSEDVIKVDGKKVRAAQHHVYIADKPKNVMSTSSDPEDQSRCGIRKRQVKHRVNLPAALISDRRAAILTNDGDFHQFRRRSGRHSQVYR
jgi:23S rRNA pseudouridine2605 synthase